MAYLIGSADTARFSSTLAINSGASSSFMIQFYVGRNDESNNSIATGTAQTLSLYISSWGTQTNLKANIYDETAGGTLVESVVVPSSVGTGLVSVSLAGTTTITSGRLYRLGIYTEDADPVTFFSDTAGLTLRNENTEGNYTTPSDPSILGSFVSFDEFYWAVQSGSDATGTATNTLPAMTQAVAGVVGSAALDAPLQYGAAFTGTYSGLSPTNPDDLVVSDGTRSMTVSTAVNTGAGTFGDTFTALPAAPGDLPAGSAVFPGSVTATFEGVDISTTLSVPTGYATFIVGASPDYTAFDASGWDEADRPVTGEAVIYDTRSGDVTMYDDLTLDAEIEDDDIYLAVIRADGSVDSGFIDTTGVPEVGSSGTATNTLPAMTQASQGDSSQTATVAQVIPLFTQSMSGFTGLGGVLAQTLPSLTQEMAGGIDTGGGISQTLPSFSQSADGTSAAVDDGSETETFNVVYRRRRRA